MAGIYDNIEKKFSEGLQAIITSANVKRVDFCVGYFNLRGWNLVVDQVDTLPGDDVYEGDGLVRRCCRLLIGMHQPPEEMVRRLYTSQQRPDAAYAQQCRQAIARDFRGQLLRGLPTAADEKTLRHLAAQLKDGKVCVKLYVAEPLHAKLYLAHRPDDTFNPILSLMGSSNLTLSGLTRQGELNAEFADRDDAKKLAEWFDDRWNDRFCIDITRELADIIDSSWAGEDDIPPYYIYLKTAYHLSADARNGIAELSLPPEFDAVLFPFQQTAVKIVARRLFSDKCGGAMIGDVVGLGKTVTACAVAKIFEMNLAASTLIICPASLQDMWDKYRRRYDLKADIVSMAKPLDAKASRYYRLIIVDESHNLRNEGGARYRNIKALIEHLGSKVLLLTATPYNKDFSDIAAQLKLFLSPDEDLGIRPERYIEALGGDHAYMQRHGDIFARSIRAFEQSTDYDDWQELMKLFLVRRTRTFIKENYAAIDPLNGRRYLEFRDGTRAYFPDRVPRSKTFDVAPGDQYSRLYSDEMVDMMGELLLPRYGLSRHMDDRKTAVATPAEKLLIDNLSRAGQRMMGFCKSTFFKRMDSSGFAFLLTVYRHILRNALFLHALDNRLPLPIGDENALPDTYIDDEDVNAIFDGDEAAERQAADGLIDIPTDMAAYMAKAAEHYEVLRQKRNVAWLPAAYFRRTLKRDLKQDCETLIRMLLLCGKWDPQADRKLDELQSLIDDMHAGDKVLVFTQYSDTAHYIYSQLRRRGVARLDLATGASADPTAAVERFSPRSNQAAVASDAETRVLVATDVLSEGQNLQDAHVVVNFDLPWAIIRLIQRAGRVDRIGQEADTIYCYSFFPADGVEGIIRLRRRLTERINQSAGILGGDEVFFEGNETNLKDIYNEKGGILDDEEDADVDLASMAYQIWKNATDANPRLRQVIPALSDVVYSTRSAASAAEDGVITYAKTYNDFDVLTWYDARGQIITQSQRRILRAMACTADTPALPPLDNHFDLVRTAVEGMAQDTAGVSGIPYSKSSTRHRLIMFLEQYYKREENVLLAADDRPLLRRAIDDIYNYPLLESARALLGRMLRNTRALSEEAVVDKVLELARDGVLCHIDEERTRHKEPSIICSMGLKYES